MLARMSTDGGENALRSPPGLPVRALAGTASAKLLEALTLAGLVLLVPRALGAADYGAFAVALAVATGIATATGIGGPALFARTLGPLAGTERRELARALVRRLGAVRGAVVVALALGGAVGVAAAPGTVSGTQIALVLTAVAFGTAATLLSQLALGLERIAAWSLRYPLENGVIVVGALALYPVAGLDGAIAAIALGSAASLGLGVVSVGRSLGGPPGGVLPAGVLRFARLQAAGGALTQVVHRGAAPACALLGVGAAATGHAAIAAGAALAITYAVTQTTLVVLPGAARAFDGDTAQCSPLDARTPPPPAGGLAQYGGYVAVFRQTPPAGSPRRGQEQRSPRHRCVVWPSWPRSWSYRHAPCWQLRPSRCWSPGSGRTSGRPRPLCASPLSPPRSPRCGP